MASIERRTTPAGERRFRVVWRFGGTKHSLTFPVEGEAKRARGVVETAGERVTPDEVRTLLLGRGPDRPLTFGEVAAKFQRRSDVKARTKGVHDGNLRCHLAALADRPIASITRDDVEEVLVTLVESGVDPRSPASTLKAVLNYGVARGHITHSPAYRVAMPARRGRKRKIKRILTEAEAGALLALADPLMADIVALTLDTGLRIAEVPMLRASDLVTDPEGDGYALEVWGGLTRSHQPGVGYIEGDGKTDEAERVIPLEDGTVALLRDRIERVCGGDPDAYLFPNPQGDAPMSPRTIDSRWRSLVGKAARAKAVPFQGTVRFHDLRHTHATWLLNAGVPPHVVQARLGHSHVSITLNEYGSVTRESNQQVRDVIARRRGSRGHLRAV